MVLNFDSFVRQDNPSEVFCWLLDEEAQNTLAFIGGFIDAAFFVKLHGVFTTNITGNFLVSIASIYSIHGVTARILTGLLFNIGVLVVTSLALYMKRWKSAHSRTSLRIGLCIQLVVLATVVGVGTHIEDVIDADVSLDTWQLCLVASMIGFANGSQSAYIVEVFPKAPSTAAITTLTAKLCARAAEYLETPQYSKILGIAAGEAKEAALVTFLFFTRHTTCFLVGGVCGVVLMLQIRFWCLLIPMGLLMVLLSDTCCKARAVLQPPSEVPSRRRTPTEVEANTNISSRSGRTRASSQLTWRRSMQRIPKDDVMEEGSDNEDAEVAVATEREETLIASNAAAALVAVSDALGCDQRAVIDADVMVQIPVPLENIVPGKRCQSSDLEHNEGIRHKKQSKFTPRRKADLHKDNTASRANRNNRFLIVTHLGMKPKSTREKKKSKNLQWLSDKEASIMFAFVGGLVEATAFVKCRRIFTANVTANYVTAISAVDSSFGVLSGFVASTSFAVAVFIVSCVLFRPYLRARFPPSVLLAGAVVLEMVLLGVATVAGLFLDDAIRAKEDHVMYLWQLILVASVIGLALGTQAALMDRFFPRALSTVVITMLFVYTTSTIVKYLGYQLYHRQHYQLMQSLRTLPGIYGDPTKVVVDNVRIAHKRRKLLQLLRHLVCFLVGGLIGVVAAHHISFYSLLLPLFVLATLVYDAYWKTCQVYTEKYYTDPQSTELTGETNDAVPNDLVALSDSDPLRDPLSRHDATLNTELEQGAEEDLEALVKRALPPPPSLSPLPLISAATTHDMLLSATTCCNGSRAQTGPPVSSSTASTSPTSSVTESTASTSVVSSTSVLISSPESVSATGSSTGSGVASTMSLELSARSLPAIPDADPLPSHGHGDDGDGERDGLN